RNLWLRLYEIANDARVFSSLTRIRFPSTTGCAQVGLEATVYSASGAYSAGPIGCTINFASLVKKNNTLPAKLRIAAFSPILPGLCNRVLPVSASIAKNWPFLAELIPYTTLPCTTGELRYS